MIFNKEFMRFLRKRRGVNLKLTSLHPRLKQRKYSHVSSKIIEDLNKIYTVLTEVEKLFSKIEGKEKLVK